MRQCMPKPLLSADLFNIDEMKSLSLADADVGGRNEAEVTGYTSMRHITHYLINMIRNNMAILAQPL